MFYELWFIKHYFFSHIFTLFTSFLSRFGTPLLLAYFFPSTFIVSVCALADIAVFSPLGD